MHFKTAAKIGESESGHKEVLVITTVNILLTDEIHQLILASTVTERTKQQRHTWLESWSKYTHNNLKTNKEDHYQIGENIIKGDFHKR